MKTNPIEKKRGEQSFDQLENNETSSYGKTLSPPPFQLKASAGQTGEQAQFSGSSEDIDGGMELLPGDVKVPFEEKGMAGRRYMPFCDFISLLRQEESRFGKKATDLPYMITQLRRIFYGTSGWENYLIPERKSLQTYYTSDEAEKRTESVHWGLITERTYQDPPSVWFGEDGERNERLALMDPFEGQKDVYPQEVKLPDGNVVDIGHVLAGLDALNFPSNVGLGAGIGPQIEDNADASTWIGDLGSVVAETVLQHCRSLEGSKVAISPEEVQAQIDALAPARDMRGNMDAYVISAHFNTQSIGEMTVTDMLEDYYLSSNHARFKPYSTFAKAIGLGFLLNSGGGDVENEWINSQSEQVSQAAEQYLLLQIDLSDKLLAFALRVHRSGLFWSLSERLLIGMVNHLHGKILQEKKK